ncbi:hypothetical protein IQ266_22020 [filamentous cyanobacterium LEGE 11480]|uniref:Transposase n=1 Tax=Romeriopsis navalis LEGE 11480 TaxID=2777977 RepID=A0A928Z6A5_9CYAN|nr:hypothetical protein [Romeriopsis navalis LEGE 11480]
MIGRLDDPQQQHEASTAAYVLSGLKLEPRVIGQIIRRDLMQESATYQVIKEEGHQEGRQEEKETVARNLLQERIEIAVIARTTGLSVEAIQALQ